MSPTILVVIGDLDVGGTEHHLVRVLPALARELGAAILALAHDPARRRRLGEAARTRFSVPAWVARYRRLYALVAGGRADEVGNALAPIAP